MNAEPGRFRPVWNHERKFLKSPFANVAVVARLRGPIEPERVGQALLKLRTIHPLLASRVVEDADHTAYLHTDDVPEIPLHVIRRTSDEQWYDALLAEHQQPFDQPVGPLIRFVLLKPDDPTEASELIVFCQHTICDGTALANLIRDLLAHYADPGLPAAPIVPPRTLEAALPQAVESRGLGSRLKRVVMWGLNRKWHRKPFYFDHQDFVEIHRAYWNTKVYRFVLLELSQEETSTLSADCKEHGVSINSALTMAFIKAYRDVVGPLPKDDLVIPYDLRRRSSESVKDAFCLLVSSVEVPLKHIASGDFWQSAQALHAEVTKRIDDRGLFGIIADIQSLDGSILDALGLGTSAPLVPPESPSYEKAQAFSHDRGNVAMTLLGKFKGALPGVIVTNLGRVELPESFGEVRVERMFFTPSAAETIPLQIGAVGAGGTLTATVNYVDEVAATNPRRRLEYVQIRDKALEYLGCPRSDTRSDCSRGPLPASRTAGARYAEVGSAAD